MQYGVRTAGLSLYPSGRFVEVYRVFQKKWHRETCPRNPVAVQQYTLKHITRKHTLIPQTCKRKNEIICSTVIFIDIFVSLSNSLG